MDMEQETVYGTHEDSHVVMSEKVQSLAGSIYQEFEKIISRYDEDVVKDLMPLVVNVLESLDLSYTQNQESEVEAELLREDNEQLVTQYEREKQLRKTAEQKLLEVEDAGEDEKKELQGKIESLESIVRMLELKGKNACDHVCRLEERDSEMKREYSKLHERYTELFKTHMDYMERTKILMGTAERLDNSRPRLPTMSLNSMSRSSGPVSFGFASLEGGGRSVSSPGDYPVPASPPDSTHSNTSLRNELQENLEKEETPQQSPQKQHSPEKGWSESLSPASKESSPETEEALPVVLPAGRSHTKREQRSANTLYQELSFQDAEALGEMDDGADITGNWVHPGEYASSDSDSFSDAESETRVARSSTVNDNFFGMGKEVENLIMENNELLATKNALNIVKDDLIIKVDELTSEQEILREDLKLLNSVKSKLQQRIQELEDELKKTKDELEKAGKANKSDDEEDVPMSQRKRFTRVEMARVLMERNQYKERFMELQEAVRFRDFVRATKNDLTLDRKSKQGIWRFFSNLFSVPDRTSMPSQRSGAGLNYNASTHHMSPATPAGPLESMRKRSQKRAIDINDPSTGEASAMRRISERREQYRQVRAHVEKDDGRLRAYGWSLPAKVPPTGAGATASSGTASAGSGVGPISGATRPSSAEPVPVPVYCRPLTETDSGTKQSLQIWCAAGVNLSGGRTRDGGSVVGTSVFYSQTCFPTEKQHVSHEEDGKKEDNSIRSLEEELKEGEELARAAEEQEQQLSSLVWICTSTRSMSRVYVVDANNPADVLKSFNVCPGHLLCIASVPGARENDYLASDEVPQIDVVTVDDAEQSGSEEKIATPKPSIRFVSCATGSETPGPPEEFVPPKTPEGSQGPEGDDAEEASEMVDSEDINPPRRLAKEVSGLVKDGLSQHPKENELVAESLERMSSVRPTMWLGAQNGDVYVHSAVSQWSRCIDSVKLKDAVLSIVHLQGRVVCALANGTVVVFRRAPDGQWDLKHYYVVELSSPPVSIRCMVGVHSRVWCGYRNQIHVLDPKTLQVQKVLDAHPRQESQVRQMAWLGEGVWVSIRLDSTLRLYHAHTYQHLQDVDIEPYVSKMLGTGKLGFSFVRITALLISSSRLWIGTGNGVIICVPLSENAGVGSIAGSARGPGSVVRVYGDAHSNRVTPGSFIPYCTMSQAQLSFHGHREAVKFFVSVPGCGGFSAATATGKETPIVETVSDTEKPQSMLVMSGGEGYIDFRVGEDDDMDVVESESTPAHGPGQGGGIAEQSHLIVWQVNMAH